MIRALLNNKSGFAKDVSAMSEACESPLRIPNVEREETPLFSGGHNQASTFSSATGGRIKSTKFKIGQSRYVPGMSRN